MCGAIPPSQYAFMAWSSVLKKHRDFNFNCIKDKKFQHKGFGLYKEQNEI
jgi:hypothetical protein